MLEPIVINSQGSALLNSLKRYTLSAVVVPRQDLAVVNVPAAASATAPGLSTPIPLQGPGDGKTELYSFTARQDVANVGIGVVTTTGGGSHALAGTGTKFTTQMAIGQTILVLADDGTVETDTVSAITNDTTLTVTGGFAKAATSKAFSYSAAGSTVNRSKLHVRIQDQAWRRYLMNRDVPAIHVFGSNTKPEFIKESLLLETDQSLVLNFYNYDTTAPACIAPMAEGRKWQFDALKYPKVNKFIQDLRDRKKWVQPYWLTLDDGAITLNAGASKGAFFTCTGDITLVLFYAYAFAMDPAGVDLTGSVTVELADAKTFRSLQIQPVPLSCAAGTAADPYRFPTPWIVEPQSQIKANFVNGSASTARIGMTFHGVAIYTGSNFNGSTLSNKHLIQEANRMYNAMSIPQVRPASPQI